MAQQPQLPKTNADRKAALLKAQQERCFYCSIHINISETSGSPHLQEATIDHFIPLSRRGARGWSNRVLSCKPCNGRKGNRLPTPEETERWNALGMSWPHLACLDLSFAYKKRCYQCNEWINPFRLKASIDSRAETRTCSERCRRKLKPTELHNREQLDAKAPCWVRLTIQVCHRIIAALEGRLQRSYEAKGMWSYTSERHRRPKDSAAVPGSS
jgi:5-methylcytosine-specific restriction endonuclease McrA